MQISRNTRKIKIKGLKPDSTRAMKDAAVWMRRTSKHIKEGNQWQTWPSHTIACEYKSGEAKTAARCKSNANVHTHINAMHSERNS